MFKRLLGPVAMIFAICMIGVVTSCKEKEDKKTAGGEFYFWCSPDLLEFISPVIHYTDSNGERVEKELKKEDFTVIHKDSVEVKTVVAGDTISTRQDVDLNCYVLSVDYNSWDINESFLVAYNRDVNMECDEEKEYEFYLGFGHDIRAYKNGKDKGSNGSSEIIKNNLKGQDAISYVRQLWMGQAVIDWHATENKEK